MSSITPTVYTAPNGAKCGTASGTGPNGTTAGVAGATGSKGAVGGGAIVGPKGNAAAGVAVYNKSQDTLTLAGVAVVKGQTYSGSTTIKLP